MADLISIEKYMAEIRRNWNVMLQENFNPIPVALEMLNKTNPSYDCDSFIRLHGQLEEAMESIVEKYYTGFNNAVSTFGGIVDDINGSKTVIASEMANLEVFRDQISYKREDLPAIWSKIERLKQSMTTMQKLDQVRSIRVQCLELIQRKFFIPLARLLAQALEITGADRPVAEQLDVDLVKLLKDDRENLVENMLEEFYQHVFLKVSSAVFYSHAVQQVPLSEMVAAVKSVTSELRSDIPVEEIDLVLAPAEFNFDPTCNGLAYVRSIVQAAAALHVLPRLISVASLEQRAALELFQLTETELRATFKRFHRESGHLGADEFVFFIAAPAVSRSDRLEFEAFAPTLSHLISDLLVKFVVILAVFKTVFAEIAKQGGGPDLAKDGLDLAKANLGLAVFVEIKNILGTFVHGSRHSQQRFVTSTYHLAEALRGKRPKSQESKQLTLFQLSTSHVSDEAGDNMVALPLTERERLAAQKTAKMLVVDPFSTTKEEFGHRPIVKPNIQYIFVMYRHYAAFHQWVRTLFGSGMERLPDVDFVETLMQDEVMPFLENYAIQELTLAFNNADALQAEPIYEFEGAMPMGKYSNYMARAFMVFVNVFSQVITLCHLLPGSQSALEELAQTISNQFLEKVDAKFRELTISPVQPDEPSQGIVMISSVIANNERIRDILSQHSSISGQDCELDLDLAEKEALLLESLKNDRSFHRKELVFDLKVLRLLVLVQRSLDLLLDVVENQNEDDVSPSSVFNVKHANRPKIVKAGEQVSSEFFDGNSKSTIQFSKSFSDNYKSFCESVKHMALTFLFTLRIEMRTHCFFYLDLAYREGNYELEESADEPEAYVSSLATSLISYELLMAEWLPFSRYHFVLSGLEKALGTMLITDFRYIKSLNARGCRKLNMNVAALEQVLSIIGSTKQQQGLLQQARDYYSIAAAGPAKMIDQASQLATKFSQLQYQAILSVYYRNIGDDPVARKEYQNHLVKLQYLSQNKHETS